MTTLEQLLSSIVELTTLVEASIGGQPGPLENASKADVAQQLDELKTLVERVLDPASDPGLIPPDAGDPDTTSVSWNAAEFAEDFKALAENARRARPGGDTECGTNLGTMRHCLDDFRRACGIS